MRTRLLALTCAAVTALGTVTVTGAAAGTDAAGAFDTAAARASLHRVLPGADRQFRLRALPPQETGDHFEISGHAGAITVAATSPATLLAGAGWYLEHVAGVDISLPGQSVSRLPGVLPAPPGVIRQAASVANRFALNDTDEGYSGPYRDFASYEREIDVLALHGVNEVFVETGTDAVYYEALRSFGYTRSELLSWIPGPAHQPWWLLQNMSSFGGPVPERLVLDRAALGKRLVDRLHDLGMTPVLPGYFGTVPPRFTEKNPSARVVPQGDWGGFTRPDWLDPRNPVFARLAAEFYRWQARLVGTGSMVKMDLLHEGGQAGDVPVADAARAVFAAMDRARPGATWVLLGWQSNPKPEIIDAVPDRKRLFIVDGLSDRYNDLDREKTWKGTPYAFGTIPNFGGHTTIGANTGVWSSRFDQWRSKPDSALAGIAYLPEGTGTDPVAFEMFTDLAWHDGPLDQAAWFAGYAARRYGCADPHATAAWDALRRGPYSMPSGKWSEAQDGLFTARPSLTATKAAAYSPEEMRYDPATVKTALAELLAVAPSCRTTDAYRYDLVNTARQVLANASRDLLPRLKSAYDRKDLPGFRALAGQWRGDLALLDSLLGSDPRFLIGPWLDAAKSSARGDAQRARFEYDARSIITTWGDRAASDDGNLHDYANRELSGLVRDFYAMRWNTYLDSLDKALVTGGQPAPIDWYALEDGWNRARRSYPVTATGDPHQLATQVANLPS
ncbi:alpha-N-acetylglucosaminidase [Amycolatopsis sp. CA-230715]|uniref:alpha-N-acetylglucosaminidase n=1 Tax=Amycolatopsis sp. CA-230715 TaxID=2745196 RepID=UPI001C01D3BD|nr:alpha-N-acetylglucosaminidase [Amycolatopsis sp. CA-230715]QWF76690.1 hypothetical protein HUW46_00066 [Amycolatopsis sp. CA-230715]